MSKVQKLIDTISQQEIDITETYQAWFEIGAALANEFGEDGRQYFHDISCNYQKYSPKETDYQYTACKKIKKISIGTLFYYAKLYDIDV